MSGSDNDRRVIFPCIRCNLPISGQSFSQPRSTIMYAMPGSDHSKVAVTAVDDRGSFVELGTTIYSDGDMAMTRWSAQE